MADQVDLTPELLWFFASLTANGGTGALFGDGGQLSGYYRHFERLAAALPALLAAAKERDQLRAEVASLRRLAPPISEEAEQLADGLVAESRRAGRRIADDRFTRLAKAVRDLEEAFGNGCGNRPCYFHNARSPGGQHTNGRCRCLDALENCDEPARGRIQAREIVRLLNAAREMVR